MIQRFSIRLLSGLSIMSVLGFFPTVSAATFPGADTPQPKFIVLDSGVKDYLRLLGGPPETVTMRSGFVVLEPGKSVGTHSTEQYEEVLVVLEGEGQMGITGGPTFQLKARSVAYCPPHTEHNVTNTGEGPLRYVYIVALATQ